MDPIDYKVVLRISVMVSVVLTVFLTELRRNPWTGPNSSVALNNEEAAALAGGHRPFSQMIAGVAGTQTPTILIMLAYSKDSP